MNIKGVIPNIINVRAQLEIKEIVIPQIKAPMLERFMPIIFEVSPFIVLQSTDNRLVRVPALFFGSSK